MSPTASRTVPLAALDFEFSPRCEAWDPCSTTPVWLGVMTCPCAHARYGCEKHKRETEVIWSANDATCETCSESWSPGLLGIKWIPLPTSQETADG